MKIKMFFLLVVAFWVYQILFATKKSDAPTVPTVKVKTAAEIAMQENDRRNLQGNCYMAYGQKRYPVALTLCTELKPFSDKRDWKMYADIKYHLAQYDDAIVAIDKALSFDIVPDFQIEYLALKRDILIARAQTDDLAQAEKIVKQITRLASQHHLRDPLSDERRQKERAFRTQGAQAYKAGHYEEALNDYTQYLTYLPDDDTIIVAKGDTLVHLKRYDEAVAQYNQIKNTLYAANKKGAALYLGGKYDDVINIYDSMGLKTDEMLYFKCLSLDKLYRVNEASACFRKLDPEAHSRLRLYYLVPLGQDE